jgi:hypothetical protein
MTMMMMIALNVVVWTTIAALALFIVFGEPAIRP